jgi:hypothetical protein
MYVFGNPDKKRGCYATFNIATAAGKGAYLELPGSTTIPANVTTGVTQLTNGNVGGDVGHDPIIVTGLSFAQKEKYHLVQCFSDHTYTYAFGHDPHASLLEVNFLGFLVDDPGTGWSNVIQTFCKDYKAARLVESKQYAKLYVASSKELKGFVVGMTSNTADAHHNLQQFSMTLLLAEAQEGS